MTNSGNVHMRSAVRLIGHEPPGASNSLKSLSFVNYPERLGNVRVTAGDVCPIRRLAGGAELGLKRRQAPRAAEALERHTLCERLISPAVYG